MNARTKDDENEIKTKDQKLLKTKRVMQEINVDFGINNKRGCF